MYYMEKITSSCKEVGGCLFIFLKGIISARNVSCNTYSAITANLLTVAGSVICNDVIFWLWLFVGVVGCSVSLVSLCRLVDCFPKEICDDEVK